MQMSAITTRGYECVLSVWQVLLVGEDQDNGIFQLVRFKNFPQLVACFLLIIRHERDPGGIDAP